jgi:RNA polymerase sigma factor (sigma-70 family)
MVAYATPFGNPCRRERRHGRSGDPLHRSRWYAARIVTNARAARLEALFGKQQRPLCRYVYQIVGNIDDALEIVQESFLRLWKVSETLDEACLEPAYLYKLARNLAIDALRKDHVRGRHVAGAWRGRTVLVLPVSPETEFLERERQELAAETLRQLEGKQRELLALRASGFSYDEIADIAGVNRGSVGQLITRALRKCRTTYEELAGVRTEDAEHASAGR